MDSNNKTPPEERPYETNSDGILEVREPGAFALYDEGTVDNADCYLPGGPFAQAETDSARARRLRDAVAYRKSGGKFLTADEFMANIRAAIGQGRA